MEEFIKKNQAIIISFLIVVPIFYLLLNNNKSTEVVNDSTISKTSSNTNISLEDYEKNARENPTYNNLIDLSVAYINNKTPEKSIDYLDKAIELNPASAVAFNNKCVAYTLMKEYDKAIEAGIKAVELDPNFQLAKNNLAWAKDEKAKLAN